MFHVSKLPLKPWWLTITILGTILALNLLPPDIEALFDLKHEPVSDGEWWRLYTSQLFHLSFNHTLLNFAGYFFVTFSFRDEVPPLREFIILFIAATSVGLGIHFLNPEIYSYVGLSGAIYGVLVAFVIIGLNKTPVLSIGFLCFIMGKFAYEYMIGGAPKETEEFIGGMVATDSHIYGAIIGIFPGFYFYVKDHKQSLRTDTKRFINQFRHPIVKDLAWAIHSPPLLNVKGENFDSITATQCIDFAVAFLPELKRLDKDPTPLINTVKPDEVRLGVYFESLLTYWLNAQTRFKLIQKNLRIEKDKQTLGEFDFIIQDTKTNENLHWEVAVKFYLGTQGCDQPNLWYGPGRKDRLDIKTNHLINKQIQLSELDEAKGTLEDLQIKIDHRSLFVKGRLFYPLNQSTRTHSKTLNTILAPTHLSAYWYTSDTIINMKSFTALGLNPLPIPAFHITTKSEWLTADIKSTISFSDLKKQLKDKPLQRPEIIVASTNHKECCRFFVVPNHWNDELTP